MNKADPDLPPAPGAEARRPFHRRRGVWIAAATVVALAAGIVASELAGWPFLQQPLQRMLSQRAGVPVALEGDFRLHLLRRPRIEVGHLNVGASPAGPPAPHLVDGRDVKLVWRWGDLWRWRSGDAPLRLRRVQAGVLDAHLLRDEQGRATWQFGANRPPPEPNDPAAPTPMPRVGLLVVEDGRIAVADRILDTDLLVEMHGREGDAMRRRPEAATNAGYEARISGRWQALPLQLQLRTGAALPLLDDENAMVPLRVEGRAGAARIFFDGQAGAFADARRIDGALRFSGPSLAKVGEPLGLTLPQTPPFELAGHLRHDAGVWALRADRATIGDSRLGGEFRYDAHAKPPRLEGRLTGQRLALADLGPAVGADEGKVAAARQRGTRVLPQREFDLPSLTMMNADVQVAVDELAFDTDLLGSLRKLSTRVVLDDGVLRLQDLQAGVAGGQLSGDTRLDSNPKAARWGAKLRFTGVDIAGWVQGVAKPGSAAAAERPNPAALARERRQAAQGGAQPVRSYITGIFTGDVDVTGSGRSTAQILGSLDGRARMSLRDGSISHLVTEAAGLDLAQALGVLVRGDQPLPLRCAVLDLGIRNGVVEPRLAMLDSRDSTLRVAGQVNLRDESLNLKAQARPKDFSPLSLRMPITIGGTLADPVVGVDGRRLAGRAIGALALGAVVGPAAALLPFVEPGSREEGDPCAAPPAGNAANPPAAEGQRQVAR